MENNMISARQSEDFLNTIISITLLDNAIDWISSNLSPEDVFSDSDLEMWAENNGYKRE
jgi:hypothetical protein